MTIAAKPMASVQNMDEAVTTGKPICDLKGSLVIPRVEGLYPRVRWGQLPAGKTSVSRWDQAQRLVDADGCDGLITTKATYRSYKTRPEYCSLELQQVIFPQVGSWATNRHSECVAQAISYGLTALDINGDLEKIMTKWYPPAPCSGSNSKAQDKGSTSRRMLHEEAGEDEYDYMEKEYGALAADLPLAWPEPSARRQLTGGREGGSDDSGGLESGLPPGAVQLKFIDFAGIFIIWASVSSIMLFYTIWWPKLRARIRKKWKRDHVDVSADPAAVISQSFKDITAAFDMTEEPEDTLVDGRPRRHGSVAPFSSGPVRFGPNDEAGMLREVLRQLGHIHGALGMDPNGTGRPLMASLRVSRRGSNEKKQRYWEKVNRLVLAKKLVNSFPKAADEAQTP